jgi:electron transport complex protein RnfE
MHDYKQIFIDGLWRNNPGVTQLLGLCPLLAVSNSFINGLGLGIATLLVLCASSFLVSLTRRWVFFEIRLPVFVLIIATLVTVTELLIKALFYDLYLNLGIFLPLIVTNCVILGRAEAFASRQALLPAVTDGIANGAGFGLVLIVLGSIREVLGSGTLFAGAEMIFGSAARAAEISILPGEQGLLMVLLPPGAFLGLALLVALKNHLSTISSARQVAPMGLQPETEAAG